MRTEISDPQLYRVGLDQGLIFGLPRVGLIIMLGTNRYA